MAIGLLSIRNGMPYLPRLPSERENLSVRSCGKSILCPVLPSK